MERLTIRNSDGTVSQPTTTSIEALFYRLAAYEDTGLEPEEIVSRNELGRLSCVIDLLNNCSQFEVSVERLRKLAEADKEGRIIILPVKERESRSKSMEREGTWLGNMLYPYFKCSVCGYKMHYINIISGWARYCPQCGAKMKQIKESEKHE